MSKKKIVIIGTGGTIAGKASLASDLTDYKAGSITVDELIQSVPGLIAYGPFESIQYSNIDSSDMDVEHWLGLQQLIQETVDREDVSAVLITHGTDTMEETAYFLHLTVKTHKPIVMTGSMRPASAISADGPINLLQAAQVARSEDTSELGVVVVMNGYIDGAREVSKLHTTDVATFGNATYGHLGYVQGDDVYIYQRPVRKHTADSRFAKLYDALPVVDILYLYAGISAKVYEAVLGAGSDGYIVAGLGHGSLPKGVGEALLQVKVPVVRSSRIVHGIVSSVSVDKQAKWLVSDSLSPVKARILLMLGLANGLAYDELVHIFKEY